MAKYTMFCLFGLTLILNITGNQRYKRRENDQPPSGSCNYFNRGGTSRLHFYVCCNNCPNDLGCDGRTYHRASSENYCNKCGKDTRKGNGQLKKTFKCGGCVGQDRFYTRCSNLLNKIPGFCWTFTNCFLKHCKKTYPQTKKRSISDVSVPNTCYNFVCDQGENVLNCPADCCQQKNVTCKWNANRNCIPSCCGESTCCDVTSSPAGSMLQTCFCRLIAVSAIFTLFSYLCPNFL